MKLISCTDYVLEKQKTGIYPKHNYGQIFKYANFLKRKLELGMFIPCDLEGNVLKSYYKDGVEHFDGIGVDELEEAKNRVLFEGFEIVEETKGECKKLKINNSTILYFNNDGSLDFLYKTIEDLTNLDLTLTDNAIKQIR